MAVFKPAYLIHGDDHGRIAERRSKLRAIAERESGTSGVEVFEGEESTPELVANALNAMTFAMGRRFVIADGVERWKEADVAEVATALRNADPESLTAAFFAREDGRVKAPKALHEAVKVAGGVIAEEETVKGRALPRWVQARAREVELTLDEEGARALIQQVGERQQRLVRELEKLAIELGPGAQAGIDEVLAACATSAERKMWTLADAMVRGDRPGAIAAYVELRGQGERVPGMVYAVLRRLRDALVVAEGLAAGESAAQVRKSLKMGDWQAKALIRDVSNRDPQQLRRALERLADLELESRGGGQAALGEETGAVRALLAATA